MPKGPSNIERSSDALRRLNITPQELEAAAQITPLLKQASGGLKGVMVAMRTAPDAVISVYLGKYDSLPVGDRERLPMEAIALAAGVDTSHLLGSIMVSLQAQAVNAVKIIAMTSQPQITRARVKFGLLPSGEKDRTALDTMMGLLPSAKGPTFIGKAVFTNGSDAARVEEEVDEPVNLDRLFPPATLMQEKLTPIRQRMLPDGK